MIIPALLALSALSASAQTTPNRAADAHFLAGYDHFRAGRADDARREWKACLESDAKNDFCEFGLSALDAGPARVAPPEEPAPEPLPAAPEPKPAAPPVTQAPPSVDRDAQQLYLEGVIYYQKGDYEKARERWAKAKELSPKGSDAEKDATAGLERIARLYGETPKVDDASAAKNLKTAEEPKDEYSASQSYFTGLIYYQKGDYERARTEWKRALALAPKGSGPESDAKAALKKLDADEASTRRDGKK